MEHFESVEELTDMFLSLAQEEAMHKLMFEIEYDDTVLKEDGNSEIKWE